MCFHLLLLLLFAVIVYLSSYFRANKIFVAIGGRRNEDADIDVVASANGFPCENRRGAKTTRSSFWLDWRIWITCNQSECAQRAIFGWTVDFERGRNRKILQQLHALGCAKFMWRYRQRSKRRMMKSKWNRNVFTFVTWEFINFFLFAAWLRS